MMILRLLVCGYLPSICLDIYVRFIHHSLRDPLAINWSASEYGGDLQFVNTYGVGTFAVRCAELAERYGERFAAPAILREYLEARRLFV